MNSALYGFWSIARKELLHIRRDPTTLIFALMIPLLQMTMFGFAIDYDVRHVRTVVVDMDRTRESRDYIAGLHNTQYLDVTGMLSTPAQAEDAIRRGAARVAVIIPPDFGRLSGTPNSPQIGVLLDGSDSQVSAPARNAFQRPPATGTSAVDVRINTLYNPQGRTQVYTIPGLVGVILQLVTVSLTSLSLVRERESGTLEQLMVSPVGRLGLMLGKLFPYSLLAMLELIGVVAFGRIVFNVQIAGSLLLLTVLALPFILAALAMGLLISTLAQNQAQAQQLTTLTLLPSILLSGYIAPRETLPGVLLLLSNILPVTYFIQILRGIIVRGTGLMDLLPPVFYLTLITLVLITLATLRFRKST
ncbi:MAG: type transporter [Chthonomonadales bacterium]|nr:type transporter [Chthonomonadales bacterium]